VVWKNTTEVGCAMAVCPDFIQVWVCSYNPPGNVSGQKPF
jgi:pathogenesis-related protein 1